VSLECAMLFYVNFKSEFLEEGAYSSSLVKRVNIQLTINEFNEQGINSNKIQTLYTL